ncbi:MAG: 2-amino-4-hydroxy-6-hydroxymethyldihydropteridine diphosphokinase [Dorea sp.]|uniref:2-amino-4-hydroxy-6- hydroxymethyldihydropteridine diphosphokinase n=1 Tax=Sporofaciens musculi TaxID=2681861 RepID=UPI0021716040|nr:2-amino-4-hydroxy-6-hydroxymethyldihydropteridine diphosphokinase [Sporofaciens musculi]MCI9422755.1 2-amino-4-hydroxy-6-hydroxymethyldihydropteridine diphosphokinase [Dorea sp.]
MDKITIKNLEVFAHHGVFPEENALGQKFIITAHLYTDTRAAGKTDELSSSIDYGELSRQIEHFLTTHTFKLLECAAESLAETLLLQTPRLKKVCLKLKKPWAPVGLPLETVSVEIERGWHTAYIALGSNMGDKENFLKQAVNALHTTPSCEVIQVSSFLSTKPYGVTDQDDFLNGCLKLRTLLPPRELLEVLHRIEHEAKRERIIHWGPRTLDLDIIFYDNLILEDDDLCIPHVDMHRREFVLKPLHEIAPYKHHPCTHKTVREMLEELS